MARTSVDQRYLRVDGRSAERVADLDGRLLKEGDTPYAHALAIQDYLRTSGGFTYSLALEQAKDSSGRPADLDPISNFLVTKQGYCVQFATAMTMMARAAGIPARMATGFLPGSATQGVWTVTAADAHAWPELYLDGVGWTRFEPTPAVRSGAPPIYAADLPVGNPATGGGRDISQPTRTARPENPKQDVLDRVDDARENPISALPVTPAAEPSLLDRLPRGWGLGLLVRPRRPARRPGRADGRGVAPTLPAAHRVQPRRGRRGRVGVASRAGWPTWACRRHRAAPRASCASSTAGRRSSTRTPPRPSAASCRRSSTVATRGPRRRR